MLKIEKVLDETLKTNGKYSRKSLTILVTFIVVVVLGFYIALSDHFLKKEINRYAIDVFDSLLIFLATLMGISEASKKFLNKVTTEAKTESVDKKEQTTEPKLASGKDGEIIG